MRTIPKIHALIEIPYVRTELQMRFAWCMIGLTHGMDALEAMTEPAARVLPRWNPVGLYGNEPEVAGERLSEQF